MAISVLKRIFSAGVLLLFQLCEQRNHRSHRKLGHYSGYGRADCGCAYSVDVDDLCGGWFRCKNCRMHPSAKRLTTGNSILKTLAPGIEKVNSTFVNKDFTINGEELVRLNARIWRLSGLPERRKEKLDKLGIRRWQSDTVIWMM